MKAHTVRPVRLGGWILGAAAIAMFGLTLPMTRMATGTLDAPQLSPWFVTFGRATVAGMLSLVILALRRAPLPESSQWKPLALASLGNVVGYPLLLALALRMVSAGHAAVITALLPLVTAAIAARVFRQKVANSFWLCAIAGSVLVAWYSLLRTGTGGLPIPTGWPELLLVGGVVAASIGYVAGARVTPGLGAERVICWVTILSLPVALPVTLYTWPEQAVSMSAWLGFAYVGLFSMWLALLAWYYALALGDPVQISQLQLLQPFFAMLFAVPLLGETIDPLSLGFGAAVVFTVYLGRRLSQRAA